MSFRIVIMLVLALLPVTAVLAKQDYTYVRSSLAFPWFMFFVIFALILIPFFMVVALAWRKTDKSDNEGSDAVVPSSSIPLPKKRRSGRFNRFALPAILFSVAIFSILLVVNAYEAMDLMEHSGVAAPTMLNARP